MNGTIAVVAGFLVTLALLSGWLRHLPISFPMLALATGVLFGPGLGVLPTTLDNQGVLFLAQISLAILLFVDATRIDLALMRANGTVPARMLLIGLPLTIGAGTASGVAVLGLGAGAAFVLACLLAPTDAALGQAIMTDERVPSHVRQTLNVESGLNDGLVVPFLTVALVVVESEGAGTGASTLLVDAVRLVGGGILVGIGCGGVVGQALQRFGWQRLQPAARQVGVAAVPVLAYALAGLAGGNGFVAAFVAGMTFGAVFDDAHDLVEFGEDAAEVLSLLTFMLFGALFIEPAAAALSLRVVVYAALSLTVVRMVPIGLSVLGAGLRPATVGLLGWFGPRGLATVVFGLEVLELAEEGSLPVGEELFGVAALVVIGSIILHGVSARPLAGAYASQLTKMPIDGRAIPEHRDVVDVPMRRASRH